MENLGYLLAMVGMLVMIGLSGAGSAIGVVIGGSAVVGMCKKKPEDFGKGLLLSGMPATQGLYGFVGFFLYNQSLLKIGTALTVFQGGVVLAAGVALGLVALISAMQQGKVVANGIVAMGGSHDVFGKTLILGAFPEFYAILAFVGTILMQPLLKL